MYVCLLCYQSSSHHHFLILLDLHESGSNITPCMNNGGKNVVDMSLNCQLQKLGLNNLTKGNTFITPWLNPTLTPLKYNLCNVMMIFYSFISSVYNWWSKKLISDKIPRWLPLKVGTESIFKFIYIYGLKMNSRQRFRVAVFKICHHVWAGCVHFGMSFHVPARCYKDFGILIIL